MENRVGFGPRLGAWVIDLVILSVLGAVLGGFVAGLFPEAYQQAVAKQLGGPGMDAAKIEQARPFIEAMTRWTLAATLVGVFYGLIEGLTAWSPGKLILGLRVADQSGQRASKGGLLLRYLVKTSGSLVTVLGFLAVSSALQIVGQVLALAVVVGCFFVLGKARQALHDRLARTIVLRKSDLPA